MTDKPTDQPTSSDLMPDDIDNSLERMLIAEGIIDPPQLQVAMVAAGMVKEIMRTAFSMRVEDAEALLENASTLVRHAKKHNHTHLDDYRQGEKAARAFLKFRRDLERLRQ